VQKLVLSKGDPIHNLVTIGFVGNKSFLCDIYDGYKREMLVYNLETKQSQPLPDFEGMAQSLDTSRTFFGLKFDHGRTTVVVCDFNENNGHISKRFLFPVDDDARIVTALKSHVLVQSRSFLKIYNARTGEFCRALGAFIENYEDHIYYEEHIAFSKSRKEVYIADEGIKAYCLEAPHIL